MQNSLVCSVINTNSQKCWHISARLCVFVFWRLGAWRSPGELILSSSRLIYLPPLLLFITSHYKLFGNLIGHTDKQAGRDPNSITTLSNEREPPPLVPFEDICACNISYLNWCLLWVSDVLVRRLFTEETAGRTCRLLPLRSPLLGPSRCGRGSCWREKSNYTQTRSLHLRWLIFAGEKQGALPLRAS